jgi:hypothetical protein
MIPVTSVISPPMTPRKPLVSPPMNPSEWTLLPITMSPGVNPFSARHSISLPEKPVMTVIRFSPWKGDVSLVDNRPSHT